MADYRGILELVVQGRTYEEIVGIVGCSRREVSRVRQGVRIHSVTSAGEVSDEELAQWFPDGRRRVSDEYDQPDLPGVLTAMRSSRHFTLLLAWRRYTDARGGGKKKYGYSQFCALFADYVQVNDLVATLHHEAGRSMLVDWAGDEMQVVDAFTGEVSRAVLFVAVLPYSGVIFVRAYDNMRSPSWLDAHVRAFAFFGGVPAIVVPDNPSTSTHRRRKDDSERVINARYQQLADHYACAIVPARGGRPRDKAAAENAVKVVNKRVIGYLEDDVFTTLAQLNEAIDERVREVNHDLRRADETTRWERFEAEEAHLLGLLPELPFEEVIWKELKVGRNYHITAEGQRYSVPYRLAGRLVRVRLTSGMLTVFDEDKIVCQHPRLGGRKGQYSTLGEHVPPQHQNIEGLWSRAWFTDRARSFGPATEAVIIQILDRHLIEAQGYLDCQNILSGLGKTNRVRLEGACQQVLNIGAFATYTTIKRIMATIASKADLPRVPRPAASTAKPSTRTGSTEHPPPPLGPDVYVRDPSHYARGQEGSK